MKVTARCLILSLAAFWLLVSIGYTQTNAPAEPKTIENPIEHKTYMLAYNMQDPGPRADAMYAFSKQYPGSVVYMDALNQAMAGYQKTRNTDMMSEVANTILKTEPENMPILTAATLLLRDKITLAPTLDSTALKLLQLDAERGVKTLANWKKPANLSDDDFKSLKEQMSNIFHGALGFAAFKAKDWNTASSEYLLAGVKGGNDETNISQYSYTLLGQDPVKVDGFWYAAKAMQIANGRKMTAFAQDVEKYAKAKYKKYHGSDRGWADIVANAATQSAPPADFATSILPADCDLALTAVKENKPEELSFSDWEYVLERRDCSADNKAAAEKIWAAIQSLQKDGTAKIKLPVKIISVADDGITAAITDDNQQANKADVQITLEKPLDKAPAVGATVNIIGFITEYKPKPFQFVMKSAELGDQ